jgi:ADP-ribose pyrophosphatase
MAPDPPVSSPPERLDRQVVFRGRVFSVRVDRLRLPGGQETRLDIVEHPGSVVVVPMDGEAVLLVRQYRHAAGRDLVELPAGTCEPGEDRLATARRELAEETGTAAGRWTHLGRLFVSPGILTETMDFYLAEQLGPARGTPDEDEDLALVRLPWAEAVARARRAAFDDLKTVAGLLMAEAAISPPGSTPGPGG